MLPQKKYVDDEDSKNLAKSGGTMSGNIDMDSNKIENLGTPTNNTDATSKKYVDDEAAKKLSLSGGVITGNLFMISNIIMTGGIINMDGHKITLVGDPTDNSDGVNKLYVDTELSNFLSKYGGVIYGPVNFRDDVSMNGNKIVSLGTPTSNTDAANKKYVDDKIKTTPKIYTYLFFFYKFKNFMVLSLFKLIWNPLPLDAL